MVGGAGIRLPAERHGRCHLGYSVYPGARGNGFAAEAADALARWGFAHGVVRVELQASVRNIASIRSALRVGFRFEGVERQAIAVRRELQDAALFARVAADPGAPIAPALAPLPEAGLTDGVIRLRVADVRDAQAAFEEVTDPVSEQWAFNDTRAELSAVTATAEAARLHLLVGPVGRLTIVDVATEAPAGSMQVRLSGPPNVGGSDRGASGVSRTRLHDPGAAAVHRVGVRRRRVDPGSNSGLRPSALKLVAKTEVQGQLGSDAVGVVHEKRAVVLLAGGLRGNLSNTFGLVNEAALILGQAQNEVGDREARVGARRERVVFGPDAAESESASANVGLEVVVVTNFDLSTELDGVLAADQSHLRREVILAVVVADRAARALGFANVTREREGRVGGVRNAAGTSL